MLSRSMTWCNGPAVVAGMLADWATVNVVAIVSSLVVSVGKKERRARSALS